MPLTLVTFLFPVMYTLYTSVSKFLPPTSYMKAIEWWLLFHILVPLIIFVVLFLQARSLAYVLYICLFVFDIVVLSKFPMARSRYHLISRLARKMVHFLLFAITL